MSSEAVRASSPRISLRGFYFLILNMRKKKRKGLSAEFKLHPYPYNLILMRANSFKELEDVWEECPVEKTDANRSISLFEDHFNEDKAFVTRLRDGNDVDFVMIFNLANGGDRPDVLAHEAYHIMNFVYKEVGAQHDIENDEPSAYFLSYIVNNLIHFLNED